MSKDRWKHISSFKDEVIEGRVIMDIWTVEDVIAQAENNDMEISEKDAIDILCKINENKDACIGINWDLIDIYLMEWRMQ